MLSYEVKQQHGGCAKFAFGLITNNSSYTCEAL